MALDAETTIRAAAEYGPEQAFLGHRMAEIERDLGKLAARSGRPTPITQPIDTLDRARELVGELEKQVLLRPIDEALQSRLAWLDRAQARRDEESDAPMAELAHLALDRRILTDLLSEWEKARP